MMISLRPVPPIMLACLLAVACTPEQSAATSNDGPEPGNQPLAQSPTPDKAPTERPPTSIARSPSPTVAYDLPSASEMVSSVPRDVIPPIYDPEFLTATEAQEVYSDYEPVIGIEIDGDARAYSVLHLNAHEIVNDEVAGRKIAVTW